MRYLPKPTQETLPLKGRKPNPSNEPLTHLPPIPPPILTDENSSEEDHTKADVADTNLTHQMLYAAWSKPGLTMSEVLKLITKSIDFVKHRRKLYNLPYDFKTDTPEGRRPRVIPID